MDQTFRLPDGKETKDANRFEQEWKALYQPLEKVLGIRVMGFDPDLLVASADSPNAPAFTLPLWMAKKILAFKDRQEADYRDLARDHNAACTCLEIY